MGYQGLGKYENMKNKKLVTLIALALTLCVLLPLLSACSLFKKPTPNIQIDVLYAEVPASGLLTNLQLVDPAQQPNITCGVTYVYYIDITYLSHEDIAVSVDIEFENARAQQIRLGTGVDLSGHRDSTVTDKDAFKGITILGNQRIQVFITPRIVGSAYVRVKVSMPDGGETIKTHAALQNFARGKLKTPEAQYAGGGRVDWARVNFAGLYSIWHASESDGAYTLLANVENTSIQFENKEGGFFYGDKDLKNMYIKVQAMSASFNDFAHSDFTPPIKLI